MRFLRNLLGSFRHARANFCVQEAAWKLHGRCSCYVIGAIVPLNGVSTVFTMDAGSIEDKIEVYTSLRDHLSQVLEVNAKRPLP